MSRDEIEDIRGSEERDSYDMKKTKEYEEELRGQEEARRRAQESQSGFEQGQGFGQGHGWGMVDNHSFNSGATNT